MASRFSALNPTPSFPAYTGPYRVGTVDVEVPVAHLPSPAPSPDSSISTIAFRLFYPCEEPSTAPKPVRWIQGPQTNTLAAFARFLGVNSGVSNIISYFPQLFYYISIPALRDAQLLQSGSDSGKWPVLVFSHGLGGCRNAYSHICGSLASHGLIVFAPEHRDGSCPITNIRGAHKSDTTSLEYRRIRHEACDEVFQGRDDQLRIRLWELGLLHQVILKLENGEPFSLVGSKVDEKTTLLRSFCGKLDAHTPGAISWAGHSFGAATTTQFVKSVFYAKELGAQNPLFAPDLSCSLIKQITQSSAVALLDLWAMPLTSPFSTVLRERPMPCFSPSGPGGKSLIAILSNAFANWSSNYNEVKHTIRKPVSNNRNDQRPSAHLFYPLRSAHLSQSDFGVLFPNITKYLANADDPARTLTLNMRAILQVLRESGVDVAPTSVEDMEVSEKMTAKESEKDVASRVTQGDPDILDKASGKVKGWLAVDVDEINKCNTEDEVEKEARAESSTQDKAQIKRNKRTRLLRRISRKDMPAGLDAEKVAITQSAAELQEAAMAA